jgi:hypothetical protein
VKISLLSRTPYLIYLTEFLKCDGTVSIIKRNDGFAGELIFSTVDKDYEKILQEMFNKTFGLKTFKRKDGFGVSNLALAVLLSKKFGIPVGKKEEMRINKPENEEEAKMILRAVIDTEGNIDDYEGRIVIGNRSKKYLQSYKNILREWFEITCSDLSSTRGWGEQTFRIGITRDIDLEKIFKIGLLNPTKDKRLREIISSLEKYRRDKKLLIERVKRVISEPKTIREISNKIKIAPFIVRRLLNSMKAKKIGKIRKNNRTQILWQT